MYCTYRHSKKYDSRENDRNSEAKFVKVVTVTFNTVSRQGRDKECV
jgi:hypothetical protein